MAPVARMLLWWCTAAFAVVVVVGRLYVSTISPGVILSYNFNIDAASTLVCATICITYSCQAFNYQDGVCMVGESDPTGLPATNYYYRVEVGQLLSVVSAGKATNAVNFWPEPSPNVGANAVDGDPTTYYHSHPNVNTIYPWWYVDLGGTFVVKEVIVLPRGSSKHWLYFKNIEVRAGLTLPTTANDFSHWPLVGTYTDPTTVSSAVTFTHPNGIIARYVSLQRMATNSKNYLVISKVEVMAYAAN